MPAQRTIRYQANICQRDVRPTTTRTRSRQQAHRPGTGSNKLLAALRVLNSYHIDLAAGQTRRASRPRDAYTRISPGKHSALAVSVYARDD